MSSLFLPLFIFSVFVSQVQALVPKNKTFQYVNNESIDRLRGDPQEYDENYRFIYDLSNDPFYFCFYNTTDNAFALAMGLGTQKEDTPMMWVWEANRGHPVRENATLTFGTDGNLVLKDADDRIAWQTNTANKGVVGLEILPNGNMVLHDRNGKFIWQSFDYPTDTLLVGQSLRHGAKLVSRASKKENVNGPYSLVLENDDLVLYYKNPNYPKPIPFNSLSYKTDFGKDLGPLQYVTLEPDLSLSYHDVNSSSSEELGKSRYNTTFSYLRLEIDGNVKLHTYEYDVFPWPWEVTFTMFPRFQECEMPERCGNFGLCEDSQCVACPSAKGLMGWSKDCQLEKLSSCAAKDFRYYELKDVQSFFTARTPGEGPMKQVACRNKCTKDCKCLGYFYLPETSMCWIAYDFKTLTRVPNANFFAYIKAPKK